MKPFLDDPYGIRRKVAVARRDPELALVTAEGNPSRVAFELVVAQGYCRLMYGDDVEWPGPDVVLSALNYLLESLHRVYGAYLQNFDQVTERFVDQSVIDNVLEAIVGTRLEAWAICLVADYCANDFQEEHKGQAHIPLETALATVHLARFRHDTEVRRQLDQLNRAGLQRFKDVVRGKLASNYTETFKVLTHPQA